MRAGGASLADGLFQQQAHRGRRSDNALFRQGIPNLFHAALDTEPDRLPGHTKGIGDVGLGPALQKAHDDGRLQFLRQVRDGLVDEFPGIVPGRLGGGFHGRGIAALPGLPAGLPP